jgi:phosphoglycerate dehydrogenase-like enzyme
MKILVAGDSFVSTKDFENAFSDISKRNQVKFIRMNEEEKMFPKTQSEKALREYLGHPKQLVRELTDEEILVVHGAPVSDEVLKASPNLRAVFCARGGPVNVDVAAATSNGIPVVLAPGKNADAVADLTIALMIMLARNIVKAYDHVRKERIVGKDNYEGNQFFGHDLGGKVLGLVGYGRVGSRVASRALGFGMSVLVYDRFIEKSKIEAPGIKVASFETIVSTSDFVSLHARESKENENLFGEKQFGMMKRTAFFLNTARPSMVDEKALFKALSTNQIAGAAMDVIKFDPQNPVSPLLSVENALILPHIGGATYETTTKGATIIARELERYLDGQEMQNVANPEVLIRKVRG